MKRCPNCNGSIIRMGHKEKPFLCKTCNKWFSEPEVTPKQTNTDRIRSMTDEELAEFIVSIDPDYPCPPNNSCSYCKLPDCSIKGCKDGWLEWLKQESADA